MPAISYDDNESNMLDPAEDEQGGSMSESDDEQGGVKTNGMHGVTHCVMNEIEYIVMVDCGQCVWSVLGCKWLCVYLQDSVPCVQSRCISMSIPVSACGHPANTHTGDGSTTGRMSTSERRRLLKTLKKPALVKLVKELGLPEGKAEDMRAALLPHAREEWFA